MLCLGAVRYEVSMKNGEEKSSSSYTTEDTSYTVTDLTAGDFYDFTVYAIGVGDRRNPDGSDTISSQTGNLDFNSEDYFAKGNVETLVEI